MNAFSLFTNRERCASLLNADVWLIYLSFSHSLLFMHVLRRYNTCNNIVRMNEIHWKCTCACACVVIVQVLNRQFSSFCCCFYSVTVAGTVFFAACVAVAVVSVDFCFFFLVIFLCFMCVLHSRNNITDLNLTFGDKHLHTIMCVYVCVYIDRSVCLRAFVAMHKNNYNDKQHQKIWINQIKS